MNTSTLDSLDACSGRVYMGDQYGLGEVMYFVTYLFSFCGQGNMNVDPRCRLRSGFNPTRSL